MSDINKDIDLPGNLADAERFQRLFVQPMVQAVKSEMETQLKPVVAGQKKLFATQGEQEARIATLEGSQKKALVGYAVFASGLSIALAAGWDWIKGWFGKGGA